MTNTLDNSTRYVLINGEGFTPLKVVAVGITLLVVMLMGLFLLVVVVVGTFLTLVLMVGKNPMMTMEEALMMVE